MLSRHIAGRRCARRVCNHIAPVSSNIDPRGKGNFIVNNAARMSVVNMPPASASDCFDGTGQRPVFLFQSAQTLISAVFGIDIDHNRSGNPSGNDSDIVSRPSVKPSTDFIFPGLAVLIFQPSNGRPFVLGANRDHGPSERKIIEREGFKVFGFHITPQELSSLNISNRNKVFPIFKNRIIIKYMRVKSLLRKKEKSQYNGRITFIPGIKSGSLGFFL